MKYFFLAALWILWCILHSAMISVTVTGYLKRRLKDRYRFYRLFYNLVALVTFLVLIRYGECLREVLIFSWEGPMAVVRWSLLFVAVVLFVAGSRKYDLHQLAGLRQITSGRVHGALTSTGGIATSGVLGITRHPWYLGAMIFIWTWYRDLFICTIVVNGILTAYLIIGTLLEERKLVLEMGDNYREYRRHVSMLIPFKWLVGIIYKCRRRCNNRRRF